MATRSNQHHRLRYLQTWGTKNDNRIPITDILALTLLERYGGCNYILYEHCCIFTADCDSNIYLRIHNKLRFIYAIHKIRITQMLFD